jgi:hypothetical protein
MVRTASARAGWPTWDKVARDQHSDRLVAGSRLHDCAVTITQSGMLPLINPVERAEPFDHAHSALASTLTR